MNWYKNIRIAEPINDINFIGDFSTPNVGWDKADINTMNAHKYKEKVKDIWKETKGIFDIYFINPNYHTRDQALDRTGTGKISTSRLNYFLKQSGLKEIEIDSEKISIVLTHNLGDNKIPLTGWMVAHRFAHSLFTGRADETLLRLSYLNNTIFSIKKCFSVEDRDQYIEDKYVIKLLGTTKASRDNNLTQAGEIIVEGLTQKLLKNNFILNRITKDIEVRGTKFFPKNKDCFEDLNFQINFLEKDLNQWFEKIIEQAKGNIFIL